MTALATATKTRFFAHGEGFVYYRAAPYGDGFAITRFTKMEKGEEVDVLSLLKATGGLQNILPTLLARAAEHNRDSQ